MVIEGGLRKPERKAIKIDDPNFWNEKDLDIELRRQFDVCHSCRRCFNLCDSFPKLFDLIDESPSMELDTVESTKFKSVTDACTLCDMCFMVSCPYVPPHEFAIDIPSIFIRYKALENKKKNNLVDSQIAKTDINGRVGVFFSIIFNFLLNKRRVFFRKILSFFLGIEASVALPKFNKRSFQKFFNKYRKKFEFKKHYNEKILIFNSCYVNYNDSKIGEALVKVLEKNKVYMEQFYEGCCKMPQLEQGKVDEVKLTSKNIADKLKEKIDQGFKVVTPIASCALMIKSHWPLLNPDNKNVVLLANSTMDIDEYIWDLNNRKGLADGMKSLNKNITLHSSCHSRAQNIGPKSAQILKLIPDTKTINVEKCSGHGGTWGIKKKWNKTARKVGLGAAKQVFKEEGIIASTCPLAGLHLQDINEQKKLREYNHKIYHPIELIAKSYGFGE
tara:strand:- start:1638 stop:2972 length:1335 start_codon:yes stop_codon:yes gene_type:complete